MAEGSWGRTPTSGVVRANRPSNATPTLFSPRTSLKYALTLPPTPVPNVLTPTPIVGGPRYARWSALLTFAVWKRVFPILIGLLPGIGIGAWLLASLQPVWIKFATYLVILPLILLQAAGWRRPMQSRWAVGLPFGSMLGVLYSVTTISGPPLALLAGRWSVARELVLTAIVL